MTTRTPEELQLGITKARLIENITRAPKGEALLYTNDDYAAYVCAAVGLDKLPDGAAESYFDQYADKDVKTLELELDATIAKYIAPPDSTPQPVPPLTADAVWTNIKAERDRRKSGGFKLGSEWFHSDSESRGQYITLLSLATEKSLPTGYTLDPAWKNMAGEFKPMTVAKLRSIRDAGLLLERTLFTVAENHRAAVNASAEPWAYDYSTGWPESFVSVK